MAKVYVVMYPRKYPNYGTPLSFMIGYTLMEYQDDWYWLPYNKNNETLKTFEEMAPNESVDEYVMEFTGEFPDKMFDENMDLRDVWEGLG